MDIEELKDLVAQGAIKLPCFDKTIEEGKLVKRDGQEVDYKITHGWNLLASKECGDVWGQYNLELLEFIESQSYSEDELSLVLESLQTEDFHWDWFAKSSALRSKEYHWFYMYAEGKPQGACVIYQPKESALHGEKIFYIEYIASAPWNRDSKIRKRLLYGVGSTLMRAILDFSVNTLNLTPGFSLHSLPQAKGYYEKLSMVNVNEKDKDTLVYFELPTADANALLGAQ